jgi:hypothetical protein
MPDRYQAAKVTNAQVADLSRLSMSTTSSSLIEPEDVVDVTISSGPRRSWPHHANSYSGW